MKRFEGPTIGQRMVFGFGVLLLIIGTLMATTYFWQRHSDEALREFVQASQPLSNSAKELENALLRVGVAVRSYVLQPQPEQLDAYDRTLRSASSRLIQLHGAIRDSEGRAMFARIEPQLQGYLGATRRLVSERAQQPLQDDAELSLSGMRESALDALREFIQLQSDRTDASLAAMQSAQQRVSQGLAISGVLSLLFFVVFAWLTMQSVRRPAAALVEIASSLRRGDWKPALGLYEPSVDAPLPRRERNELAQIGRAFGSAATELERRSQRMAAHRRVAEASVSGLDQAEVARQVLDVAVEHLGAELGIVYVLDAAGGKAADGNAADGSGAHVPLQPVASFGLALTTAAAGGGEGLPQQAVSERKAVRIRDIPPDSGFQIRLGYDAAPPREVIAAPICFQQRVLGVLLLAGLHEFDDAALDFITAAADQFGVGLNNAQAHAHVQGLLRELADKSRQIQAQNEELQAQNEEIQAQSEEAQAQNEELQAQGEEIRAQHEQLLEQTAQLREQSLQLADSDRRKNEFLGLLAHELRNPMAGISNSLFVLSRPGLTPEQADSARGTILRQTRQLNRLIDDLLDITRVSHGKISLKTQRLDLVPLLREWLQDQRAAFEAGGIELNIDLPDEPVWVDADRARVCQIVGNLVDNALKFTDSGGRVDVVLRVEDGGGATLITVTDSGIGIEPAVFARLFEPFSQGDPSIARRSGGLGLGLALVKALVEMHGGSVEAFSEGVGRGARFAVRLPLADAEPAAASQAQRETPAEAAARRPAPCRILIIEDNADAAQSLAAAMQLEGHSVRVAHSADDGLAVARQFRPDALLCDIGLPVIDGYEVARRFRADPALRDVYLVAVTGYAGEREREQAARAGFDRHLAKPPDLLGLAELLADVAARRGSLP
ncbi:MAG: ATP-binding protein [Burkholderiaceae bacterium]